MASVSPAYLINEKALRTLAAGHAAAQKQLATLEAKAYKIRKAKQKIEGGMFYYKWQLSAVRRLPPEVLTHIFWFLVGSAPDAVLQASLVCHEWRSAAMFSQLWSNITIISETHAAVQKLLLYLQRSHHASLNVTFVQSFPPNRNWPAWIAVKNSVCRWSSLSLTLDNCQLVSHVIRSLPAVPTLVELHIAIRGNCVESTDDGNFGFEPGDEDCHHEELLAGSLFLKTLHLSTWILPNPGYLFFGLTNLTITDTFSSLNHTKTSISPMRGRHLLGLLQYCCNLEKFTFNAEGSVSWFALHSVEKGITVQSVSLPRLRNLDILCHYSCLVDILPRIDAPNIESGSLLMRPRYEAAQNRVLQERVFRFLGRCQRLKKLRIHAFTGLMMIRTLVTGVPHLESLHLDHCLSPDTLIRALGIKYKAWYLDKRIWLAPKLSTLVIHAQHSELVHENLSTIVQSRYYSNLNYGTPSALDSFIVNGHDMLKGMPPGEIAPSNHIVRFGGQTWEMHQGYAIQMPWLRSHFVFARPDSIA